jgi:hypothetical protein
VGLGVRLAISVHCNFPGTQTRFWNYVVRWGLGGGLPGWGLLEAGGWGNQGGKKGSFKYSPALWNQGDGAGRAGPFFFV